MKTSIIMLLGALMLALTVSARAQTSVWSGASLSSGNWTDGANWVGGTPPAPGDVLVFPAVEARKVITNNFAAFTSFKLLVFDGGGYQLRGNNIRLTGETPEFPIPGDPPNIIEYTATATNEIFFNILVAESNKSAAIEAANKANSVLTLHGDINLIFGPVLVFESGVIDHRGAITGIGNVQVYPNARAAFNNTSTNNSYDGFTAVSGELELFKDTAIPGEVQLSAPSFFPAPGAITWFADDQVYDFGEFDFYGTLGFPGTKDTIGSFYPFISVEILGNPGLSLNGDIKPVGNPFIPDEPCKIFGSGAWLTFTAGDHTINQTGLVSGLWLDVRVRGPGNINKIGTNVLYLVQSNDFTGVLTINDGPVVISNNWALGALAGNTVVGSGGQLVLTPGVAGLREPLMLQPGSTLTRSLGTWTPAIIGNIAVTGPGQPATIAQITESVTMIFSNSITGAGTLDFYGKGQNILRGPSANTFSGTMRVRGEAYVRLQKSDGTVAVSGPLVIGDELGLSERLDVFANEQIADSSTVTVREDGQLAIFFTETLAAVTGSGEVNINGLTGVLNLGHGGASFTFDGAFDDAGPLGKIGDGTGILAGDSPFYTGDTTIYGGSLDIRGDHRRSTVSVIPGARLTGNGSISNLFVQNGGIYQPGRAKQDGLNEMTSGHLNLAAGSIFRAALWGGGANQHGRAAVKGVAVISNAVLDVQLLAPPPVGAEYMIIDNDGADLVNGTFAGLPGGEFTGPGGLQWEIEYGNDVFLRLLSQGLAALPPSLGGEDFADIIVQGGNGDAYVNPNECVQLYIPIYNEESFTSGVAQVTLVSYFEDLVVHQPYSLYPAIPPDGNAYNITPFQVSVPKGFACGTNLPMALVIQQGTNAPYALPIVLPTGKPAAEPMRLDSAGPMAIPDEALLIDFVFVSDFTGHLAKVEVSLHINHAALETLNVTLVGPGDIQIPLALGLSGGAFGNGCADSNRTAFAADADTFIGDASAPFVGTFRPVGILPILRGLPEGEVENRWYLWVEDTATGTTGTLECWSLFLYPAECEDGEGVCALCPEPIFDSVDLMELPGAGRLARFDAEAGPTACGDEPAPDYFAAPGDFYYKTYTFYNQNEAETCVSVTLYTSCTGANAIVSSAHLGGYNPPLAWTNVLGYIGEEPGYDASPRTYSFLAPGLSEITIVVSGTASYTPCGGFTLLVTSPDLCPAELAIRPAGSDQVQLDWSTGAAGYLLQKNTSMMAPTNWVFVPESPVVSGDRFVVTNEPLDPKAFFRLLKP